MTVHEETGLPPMEKTWKKLLSKTGEHSPAAIMMHGKDGIRHNCNNYQK